MTEPTPVPDEPGAGLRTRPAPGSGAQVNGARRSVAHGTATLDTVALETSTNGKHNGHDMDNANANNARNGHSNGHSTRNGHNGHNARSGDNARSGPDV